LSACPPGGGSLASEPVDTVTGDGVGVCLAFVGAGLFHSVRPCNACWARYREDSAVRLGRTELAFLEAQLGPSAPECTSLGEGLPPVDVRLRACKAGASQPALPVAQRLEFFQTDAVASGTIRDSSSEVHKAALDSGANVRISGKESGFAWLARLPRPVRVYLGDDETALEATHYGPFVQEVHNAFDGRVVVMISHNCLYAPGARTLLSTSFLRSVDPGGIFGDGHGGTVVWLSGGSDLQQLAATRPNGDLTYPGHAR